MSDPKSRLEERGGIPAHLPLAVPEPAAGSRAEGVAVGSRVEPAAAGSRDAPAEVAPARVAAEPEGAGRGLHAGSASASGDSGAAPEAGEGERRGAGALWVGAGILLSRLFGLVREQAVSFFFGLGPHSDALTAALRVPNMVQNLLGEGVLSASVIPIYSRLLAEGRREEAGRFAGAVFGLLLAAAAAFALAGTLLARPVVALLAWGYRHDAALVAAGRLSADRFELSVHAVRIMFPMAGVLVLSVWALAILNSHRRFFLPYFAPVLWNSAMIGALVFAGSLYGHRTVAARDRLLAAFCWGALAGGLLQAAVQLPAVVRVLHGFRLSFSAAVPGVRQALAAWGPAVAGRGVVQIAGYVDLFLASLLAAGAVGADRSAQTFYLLPISLFGMSVAASELPELSRLAGRSVASDRSRPGPAEAGPAESGPVEPGSVELRPVESRPVESGPVEAGPSPSTHPALLARVRRALRLVAFLNVPTVVAYLAFGYLVVGALLRHGSFDTAANWLVYLALCGYSTGILATTSSRLLQNTFWALGDTSTPARTAGLRVLAAALAAVPLMLWLDRYPLSALVGLRAEPSAGAPSRLGLHLGVLGLSFASGVGAWLELSLLRRALRRRLPAFELPLRHEALLALLALAAALPAALLWWLLPPWRLLRAAAVLATYGLLFLLACHLAGIDELTAARERLARLFRPRPRRERARF